MKTKVCRRALIVAGLGVMILAPAAHGQEEARARRDLRPGSRDEKVTITITNPTRDRAFDSVSLAVAEQPSFVENVRITPDGSGPVPPGGERKFAVLFDISARATAGTRGTVRFKVSAEPDVKLDFPSPSLDIEVQAPPSAAEAETPAGRKTPDGKPAVQPRSEKRTYAVLEMKQASVLTDAFCGSTPPQSVPATLAEEFFYHVGEKDGLLALIRNEDAVFQKLEPGKSRCAGGVCCSCVKYESQTSRFLGEGLDRRAAERLVESASGLPANSAWWARKTTRRTSVPLEETCFVPSAAAASGRVGTPSVAAQPPGGAGLPGAGRPGAPKPIDPRDPSIAGHIQRWVSVAEPPENATEGARLRYNEWGVKLGSTATAVITGSPGKPSDVGARTSPQYLWDHRQTLDSVNHCTLEEFVTAQVAGLPIDRCRGRFQAKAGAPPSGATAKVAVADVAGLSAQAASSRLKADGLTAELVGGRAPRSREEQYTVERQEPAAGTQVARGSAVRVAVRPAYVEPPRAVSSVVGLTAATASERLTREGLQPEVVGGDPAPSKDREFTVQEQQPAAGASVPAGSKVVLRVHSQFDPRRTVPSVVGLSATDADQRLRGAGFVPEITGGDPAPRRGADYSVQSQRPAANSMLEAGARVQVRVHSAFVEPPPAAQGPPAQSPVADGLIAAALAAANACQYGMAAQHIERLAAVDPGNPWLGSNAPNVNRLAARERETRDALTQAQAALGGSDLLTAQAAIGRASQSAPPCLQPPVNGLAQDIAQAIEAERQRQRQQQRERQRQAAAEAMQTLMRTLGQMRNPPPPVAAPPPPATPPQNAPRPGAATDRCASQYRYLDKWNTTPECACSGYRWNGVVCVPDSKAKPGQAPAGFKGFPSPSPAPTAAVPPRPGPVSPGVVTTNPGSDRPMCTCKDASGKQYRMVFGQDCDPASSLRSDDCNPN